MDSAHDWKIFYEAERARVGPVSMMAMVDYASSVELGDGGALVIPHTHFEATGPQMATAVATELASGTELVLALGVLPGGRRSDRQQVALARDSDLGALAELRGVHDESGLAAEEFSLDAFVELLDLAATRTGRKVRVVMRYPFLAGPDPSSLPGLGELKDLMTDGALLVATADPVLARLLGEQFETQIHDLVLVDYSEVLAAPSPSSVV